MQVVQPNLRTWIILCHHCHHCCLPSLNELSNLQRHEAKPFTQNNCQKADVQTVQKKKHLTYYLHDQRRKSTSIARWWTFTFRQAHTYNCGLFNLPLPLLMESSLETGHLSKMLWKAETPWTMWCWGMYLNSEDKIDLYCTFRMPEILPMVQCSSCKEWYHVVCISVPQETIDSSSVEWACTNCNTWE